MNERIRKLRKILDLTQTEFAEKIGLVQNTITGYEKGRILPSDQTILFICREFNVNEKWLREGIGEIFRPAPKSELKALAKKYELSNEDFSLIEEFINLKKEQRIVITEFVKKAATNLTASSISENTSLTIPANATSDNTNLEELSNEEFGKLIRQHLSLEKKAKEKSEAS